MYIDVTESTADFLRLRMGMDRGAAPSAQGADAQVKLTLSNGAPYPQLGTLQFTDATVDESTGAVTLRTLFPNPDHLLLPGMYVRAEIVERVDDHGILVSQRGVGRDQKGQATALVVTADNKVEQHNITASRTVGDSWLVESGVRDGDRVIVEGVQKVQPGQVVKADEIATPDASAPQASTAADKPANP
jgi:membrane fusion protein (multidrug efflux system)